jgi:hypothetical protein
MRLRPAPARQFSVDGRGTSNLASPRCGAFGSIPASASRGRRRMQGANRSSVCQFIPDLWSPAREQRQLAGMSQSEVQVGRRKAVIQAGPAGEILSGSPGAACGRLPEVTNGCFVEAKHEKPALSNGQLWRNPKVGSGSIAHIRHDDLNDRDVGTADLRESNHGVPYVARAVIARRWAGAHVRLTRVSSNTVRRASSD